MSTFEKLREIYYATAEEPVPEESFKEDSKLLEDLGCNSVALLYMAMSIEEEFGVSFTNEDLESFTTVSSVISTIEALLK